MKLVIINLRLSTYQVLSVALFSPKLNSAGSLVLTTNRSSPNSITGFITMCKYVVFETFKISKI